MRNITLPITDKKIISRIKKLYKNKEMYRELLLFILAINTGLRYKDLMELKISDVAGRSSMVLKDGIRFEFDASTKEIIDLITMNKSNDELLFSTETGKVPNHSTIWRSFKKICKELNLGENISVESWRRTFGYFFYLKYKDLFFLQCYLGHLSQKQTAEYIGIPDIQSLNVKYGVNL